MVAGLGAINISATRREVRAGLGSLGLYVVDLPNERLAARRKMPVDTLLVYIRQPPERDIGVTIEVREVAPNESRIELLAVSAHGPEPRRASVGRAFHEQVVDPLRRWVAQRAPER
jgi:hypothetical protein